MIRRIYQWTCSTPAHNQEGYQQNNKNSQRDITANYNVIMTNRYEPLTNDMETDTQLEEDILNQIRESNAKSQANREKTRLQKTNPEPVTKIIADREHRSPLEYRIIIIAATTRPKKERKK